MSQISALPPDGEFLLYTTEDGQARLEVRLNGETVWLSLAQLAELFQRDKSVISRHIKNVFDEGELVADSVVANFATTAADAKTYKVAHYQKENLLARSLHSACYQHNPGFLQLMARTSLPFKSFDEFKKVSFDERYAAYQGIAKQLWSLSRLQEAADATA
jgi:hypothetical protein